MNRVDNVLVRLEKVKRTGPKRWTACCPAHDDREPSLVIRETDEELVLLKCFAGCEAHAVLAAAGLQFQDLYPEPTAHYRKPERRPFPAADILRCIAFEALVVAASGAALLAGQPFTAVDRERLMLAVSRIQAALTAGGLNRE